MRRTLTHSAARRRVAASTLILAGACAAALPAGGLAASSTARYSYKVTVNKGVLTRGNTVQASATVTDPEQKVKDWWSKSTVSSVVRKGVNGGYQRPYASQGYRCTPVVRSATTSFTCKLQGADVATSIKLTFAVKYRQQQQQQQQQQQR